jgi:threonine synthase
MAAAIGQKAVIFAPKNAPSAKIAQLLVYGADVFLVDGGYDAAFDLSVEAAQEFGWYCRNTGYNPFTAEGKKTAAFEIWECILNSNRALPDSNLGMSKDRLAVFVSVGDGNIISGIHKGFKDLQKIGLLEQMPRIFGVQSKGSAAIANAFLAGREEINPVSADTIADSISVDMPRDGVRAVRAAVHTEGAYLKVSDDEILDAIATLGENGIFAEPAGAASYAGLVKAVRDQLISADTPVVVINTGSGLKDVGSAMQAVGEAQVIEPSIKGVKRVLK